LQVGILPGILGEQRAASTCIDAVRKKPMQLQKVIPQLRITDAEKSLASDQHW
jgi:hypothetical protein